MKKKYYLPLFLLGGVLLTGCDYGDILKYPETMFRPEYYSYHMWVFYGLLILGTINLAGGIIFRVVCKDTIFKNAMIPLKQTIVASVFQYVLGLVFCIIGIFADNLVWHYMAFFYCWVILAPATTWVRESTEEFRKATSFWFLFTGITTVSFVLGFLFFQDPWVSILYATGPIHICLLWLGYDRIEDAKDPTATMGGQCFYNVLTLISSGWITFICYPIRVLWYILYVLHVLILIFFFAMNFMPSKAEEEAEQNKSK